jgi:hypothetical protein
MLHPNVGIPNQKPFICRNFEKPISRRRFKSPPKYQDERQRRLRYEYDRLRRRLSHR